MQATFNEGAEPIPDEQALVSYVLLGGYLPSEPVESKIAVRNRHGDIRVEFGCGSEAETAAVRSRLELQGFENEQRRFRRSADGYAAVYRQTEVRR